jgi:folate-binding protein YgfZ
MSQFRRGALVRRTDRGVVRLRGGERSTWLQGLVTNDVLAVMPGDRSYGAWLTPQGRMITDLWAVPLTDALLLDVPAPLAAGLAQRLDGLVFAEDVQIDDASSAMAVLELYGGDAPPLSGDLVPVPCADAIALVPDRTLGVAASVFYLPAMAAHDCADAIVEATGATAADLDAWDVLRIEAGVPKFLVDMTEETIPLEAGLEHRAISFAKGCYVGQEVIVRVMQRGGGRVAKRLVGLTLEGSRVPAPGAGISAGTRAIGRVTSVTFSPVVDRVIGLGYVHRDFVEPGTPVEVIDDAHVPAVVTALPFVAPV